MICDLLSDFGLPILSGDSGNKVDYKSDFQFLRAKMLDRMKKIENEQSVLLEKQGVADTAPGKEEEAKEQKPQVQQLKPM